MNIEEKRLESKYNRICPVQHPFVSQHHLLRAMEIIFINEGSHNSYFPFHVFQRVQLKILLTKCPAKIVTAINFHVFFFCNIKKCIQQGKV